MSVNINFTIESEMLVKGLRPFEEVPRDSRFLVESKGAMGRHGALVANQTMLPLDTSVITDGFPYPQIFAFAKFTIVCGATKIYEVINGTLTLKLTVASPCGGRWNAVDFYDYIYMSNGEVAVKRNVLTGEYTECTTLPVACAMCNYNGQVLVSPSSITHTYTAGSAWAAKAPAGYPGNRTGTWTLIYNDNLYGVSEGILYKWDGVSTWNLVVVAAGTESCVYSGVLVEYKGRLFKVSRDIAFKILITSWAVGESVWTVHYEKEPNPVTGACAAIADNNYIYLGSHTGQGRLWRWELGDENLTLLGTAPYIGVGTNKEMLPFIYEGEIHVLCGYTGTIHRWLGTFPADDTDISTLTEVAATPTEHNFVGQTADMYTQYTWKNSALYVYLYQSVSHYYYLYKWAGGVWIDMDDISTLWSTRALEDYGNVLHVVYQYGRLYTFDQAIEDKTKIVDDAWGALEGQAQNLFLFNDKFYVCTNLGYLYEYTATFGCVE